MTLKTFFAYDPNDSDEVRLEKFAILLVAGACSIAGLVWTTMYALIFGWSFTTLLPLSFTIIVGSALVVSHLTKKHIIAIYAQIVCILYVTTFIQWSIGSVFDSGIVLVWAFLAPICALMFLSVRQSLYWFALYLLNLFISVVFNDFFMANGRQVEDSTRLLLFMMNFGVSSVVVFSFAGYYVNMAIREQKKSNQLLQTNLQQTLALQLNEKLATLGKLSAGVTHELNNPVAAAQRGAAYLQQIMPKLEQTSLQVGQLKLPAEALDVVTTQGQYIRQQAKQPPVLSSFARSDQESNIESLLDEKNVESAWELAPMLVSAGYTDDSLANVAERFSDTQFSAVATLFGYSFTAHNVLEDIGHGLGRVVAIVNALKSYSYLDQAPIQSVDIHDGLNDTLIMFESKLKMGIDVRRDYADGLPRIEAYGSELNQVWTNIIENAITAMKGQGELIVKTSRKDSWVIVDIQDSGSGIPPEHREKVFDPFFTTKAPGEGTGLGLSISHNIVVQKHKGAISVHSRPGETRFEVKLPIHSK